MSDFRQMGDFCCLAVQHITPGDVEVLEAISCGSRPMPICVMRTPFGFHVYVGEASLENEAAFKEVGLSDAFLATAAFARTNNCEWVTFDDELEVDPDDQLATYPRFDPLGTLPWGRGVRRLDLTTNLLALATTALRDLYMGYPPDQIVANSGDGLDTLLRDLVGHLRGQGHDDDGGWDCAATQGIEVKAA